MEAQPSIVRYVGKSSSNSCGYCKSTQRAVDRSQKKGTSEEGHASSSAPEKKHEASITFGIWAYHLNVSAYLDLMDRGWRRSGRYLYKPVMDETCCPQYTIRLDIHKFQLSRTQKRALRAMLDFLKNDKRPTAPVSSEEDHIPRQRHVMKSDQKSDQRKEVDAPSTQKTQRRDCDKPYEKKKVIRRRRAEERLKSKGIDIEQYKQARVEKEMARKRTLESFLEKYVEGEWKHKLETRLVPLESAEFAATLDESFQVYRKYQCSIHEDDDLTKSGFSRFLVSSPLFSVNDGVEPALGSYHQQYLLDGKIIAVGVVDILPRCLSAKYFFYDPAYKFLSLGTYSALREIVFTQSLCVDRPELHYYYMGYYLYDCPKMRYKGKFRPSDLLCDKTRQWIPLSICAKLLEANNGEFTTFGNPEESQNEPEVDIDEILCIKDDNVVPFGTLKTMTEDDSKSVEEKLNTFVTYAGPVVKKVLLYI